MRPPNCVASKGAGGPASHVLLSRHADLIQVESVLGRGRGGWKPLCVGIPVKLAFMHFVEHDEV